MTKRLNSEEDAKALRDGPLGIQPLADWDGPTIIRIDKNFTDMEITREGERFLEVRFKRRESVDAGKLEVDDISWSPTLQAADGRYAEQRMASVLNFAGHAQEREFNAPRCPHGFKLNIHGFADHCPMFCGH